MAYATPERTHESSVVVEPPRLYAVWIDTNMGYGAPDWEANSHPTTRELAEQEASVCLALGFLSVIMPDGETPRADGFFSNPATDPD